MGWWGVGPKYFRYSLESKFLSLFYLTLGLDLRLGLELEKEKIFLAFVSKLLQTVREIR